MARWFAAQPEVARTLHPALPTCPGHEVLQRDFTGSSSVFSVVFTPETPTDAIIRFIDRLRLFKIGYSWGGVTSLAMPFFDLRRSYRAYGDQIVRFNVGLETASDLIADLEQGFSMLRR